MDFSEFWQALSDELSSAGRFETLKRSRAFYAVMADPWTVTVTPESTRTRRTVTKGEFEQIWDMVKGDARNKRYVGTRGRFEEFENSAYVCALVDHLVGDRGMQ